MQFFYVVMLTGVVGMSGLNKGIGPRATPEDIGEPEDKPMLVKVGRLSSRGWELVTTSRRYCMRR